VAVCERSKDKFLVACEQSATAARQA